MFAEPEWFVRDNASVLDFGHSSALTVKKNGIKISFNCGASSIFTDKPVFVYSAAYDPSANDFAADEPHAKAMYRERNMTVEPWWFAECNISELDFGNDARSLSVERNGTKCVFNASGATIYTDTPVYVFSAADDPVAKAKRTW